MQSPYSPYDSPISPVQHTSPVMSPSVQPYSPNPSYSPAPSQQPPQQQMSSGGGGGGQVNRPALVAYLCAHCGYENLLSPETLPKCSRCPHRVMFKKRTNRSMFFLCKLF